MNSIDWAQVIFYLISLGVVAGIAKQRIDNLVDTTNTLKTELATVKEQHNVLKDDHHKIKLTVVTVPTKEDMNHLTREVTQLRLTITRLETILEQLAIKTGISFNNH